MKQRNPIAVVLLSFITLGIYSIYWYVVTKGEMNQKGATIPTAWLIIIPFVNIWWMWKYSEGVELVTDHKMSTVIAFVLLFVLGPIGSAVLQDSFNKVGNASVAGAPASSTVPTTPSVTPPPAPATPTVKESAPTTPSETKKPPANPVG